MSLSPRAEREALQGLSLCLTWLDMPLREGLLDADRRLFALAEGSRNHLEQQDCFQSRAIVQREGAAFRNRFAASLSEGFRRLGTPSGARTDTHETHVLTLVDPDEQALADALARMAARAEARSASSLFELSYRFAALAGVPPLEGDALPPGPLAMARALCAAAEPMPLPPVHRLVLLEAMDVHVMSQCERFYGALNDHYRGRGVLPGFRIHPHARVNAGPAPERRARADEESHPLGVLESLRDLLAGRYAADDHPAFRPERRVSRDELQTALMALQGHVAQVTDAAQREIRSAAALREELLAQLNRGRPMGAPPAELTPEQSETVDLAGLLFQALGEQLAHDNRGRPFVGGLQWPMVRAAVADRGFFDHPDHPARQLLETMGHAAYRWLDPHDGEPDGVLLDRMEQVVQQATHAQVVDPAWRASIEQQLALLARKAHVAERRQVEAMDGRDRLEQARRRAGEIMQERLGRLPAPDGVLRVLLERTWSDVLALHLLRGGEHGDAFIHCLAVTDQLLGRRPVSDARKLRQDVERGLEHLGMHATEAAQVAAGVFDAGAGTRVGGAESPVAARLRQRPRLGEGTPHAGPLPAVEPIALDPAALAVYQRFAELRFGTWFEFQRPNGVHALRKLAWFSLVTGRCLFVNLRGQRAEDMDLTRLASLVASGAAREVKDDRASFIDRAWRSVTRHLRDAVSKPSRAGQA